MKVLIACEESQAVCKEFRRLGHEAYSCDIIECSGGHPEWHIVQDVLPLLNGRCTFRTMDGKDHRIGSKWDMLIAFPPCTHLAVSGARHFKNKRADGRQQESIEFFCTILNADCERIAVENPVGIISGDYIPIHFPNLAEKYGLPIKPTQIIQPYQYGDNGNSLGLLQVQPRWHTERMERLGCSDLLDPFQNVTVAVDLLSELMDKHGDIAVALTVYNNGHYPGYVTEYAKVVLNKAGSMELVGDNSEHS